jgi:hypothetical protein
MRHLVLISALALGGTGCGRAAAATVGTTTSPAFDRAFWDLWGDGQAELAGYRLTTPRYQEQRTGRAVAIFVAETFSETDRVKADPGRHPKDDEVPAFKLNLVKSFQTGVYDYDVMTSTFLALVPRAGRPPGAPLKVSFSAQEWCGSVYHHLLFDDGKARETLHSYFDGEGDKIALMEAPNGGLVEDALLLWARGLAAPQLAPGAAVVVPFLGSLNRARFAHQPLAWTRAKLAREAAPRSVVVPAGTFDVEVLTVAVDGGPVHTFFVERAAPHRVVKWTTSDGETAELTGAARMKYWELHKEGDEAALARIGLPPPAR